MKKIFALVLIMAFASVAFGTIKFIHIKQNDRNDNLSGIYAEITADFLEDREDSISSNLPLLTEVFQKSRQLEGGMERMVEDLQLDGRPVLAGLMDFTQAAYLKYIKDVVNPNNRSNFTAIYGGMGADLSSILLATNARLIVGVDTGGFDRELLIGLLKKYENFELQHEMIKKVVRDYFHHKYINGAGSSGYKNSKKATGANMPHVEMLLLAEMRALGIERDDIDNPKFGKNSVRLKFRWKHRDADRKKQYTLLLIKADVTKPEKYPPILESIFQDGFDVYLEKAATQMPAEHDQYMPLIAFELNPNGFLLTSNLCSPKAKNAKMTRETGGIFAYRKDEPGSHKTKVSNLDRILEKSPKKVRFFQHQTDKLKRLEIMQGLDRKIQMNGELMIARAFPYWWKLNIRQKLGVDTEQQFELTQEMSLECQFCGNQDASQVCSRCKLARYCSIACQKDHWKIHKKVCKKAKSGSRFLM